MASVKRHEEEQQQQQGHHQHRQAAAAPQPRLEPLHDWPGGDHQHGGPDDGANEGTQDPERGEDQAAQKQHAQCRADQIGGWFFLHGAVSGFFRGDWRQV
jgi:hypothetical protein